MKHLLTCLIVLVSTTTLLLAQQDSRIATAPTPLSKLSSYTLPPVDNQVLLNEEMERRVPGRAPKFATTFSSNISPLTHGTWEDLTDGQALWRMRISSKGAKSLNLGFTTYQMPKGGSMILYSPDQAQVLGPFTPADNEEHAQLWTPILKGDELVIEVQVPTNQKNNLQLVLSSINHDFLGFSNLMSGACNLDVICGATDGLGVIDRYRDIIQSVGVYGFNGSTFCTGFLVNNTAQDCKPLFMTADHCGITTGNAATVVVYWNFQNSTCRQPNSSSSGANGDGTLSISNSGAIYRAGWSGSDFNLIELDDPINPLANPFFAGWDRSMAFTPDSVLSIHHPNSDEKRISFEFDDTFIGDDDGNSNPNQNFVVISDWDLGTTEGGSSGAPLFDKNKRVLGQLFGGLASCGNNSFDAFGWIFRSWTGAGTPSTRLSDWLDPIGSGVMTLDGKNCATTVITTPSVATACSPGEVNFSLQAGQGFGGNINLSIGSLPTGFTSGFSQNPIAPGDSSTLTLQIPAGYSGTVDFDLNGTDGVESSTTSLSLQVSNSAPSPISLSTPAANEIGVSISTLFQWLPQSNASYELQISTDSLFNTLLVDASGLLDTEYQLDGSELLQETRYFWRVRGTNPCGPSPWSNVSPFTTGALFCETYTADNLNITISPNGSGTVSSSLTVPNIGTVDFIKINNLGITHSWVGDLDIVLSSPSGTSGTLFDEPDCDGDDLALGFDDNASMTYQDLLGTCEFSSPSISGVFQPLASLSAFAGEPTAGIWTLSVTDNANEDGGSLDQWTLEICTGVESGFSINTHEASICDFDTVAFSLRIGSSFEGAPVNLTANNLPAGALVSFDPGLGAANSTVNGKLFGFSTAGDFPVEIVASNANDTRSIGILVHVLSATQQINLLSPADQIGGLPTAPLFVWNSDNSANSYRIEIASDSNFANLVNSGLISDTSWVSPELDYGTHYYWRVIGLTECGETKGEVRSFGTDFRVGLEKELGGAIQAFPNPGQDLMWIQLPSLASQDLWIELYTMEGKRAYKALWPAGALEHKLDLEELKVGIYVLSLKQGNLEWKQKLVRIP